MHSLVLDSGVERFRPRIVSAHSGTLHGRADTIGLQVAQGLLRRVLTAPGGVKPDLAHCGVVGLPGGLVVVGIVGVVWVGVRTNVGV